MAARIDVARAEAAELVTDEGRGRIDSERPAMSAVMAVGSIERIPAKKPHTFRFP